MNIASTFNVAHYERSTIQEYAVVGLPDKEYGERVTAFIVPHKDQQPDLNDLKAYLKTHLAGFKVPKKFSIVDELPKNPAGKMLKREIKDRGKKLEVNNEQRGESSLAFPGRVY